MRILWVKVGGLWPLTSGGRLRSFNIVNELAHRHEVSVLTTHARGEDPRDLECRLAHCRRVESFPFDWPKWRSARFPAVLMRSWLSRLPVEVWKQQVPALRYRIRELLQAGKIDVCVADFLVAVPNIPRERRIPIVFFAHNVDHLLFRRLCRAHRLPWFRIPLEIEWRKERRYEARTCRNAELTVAVSPEDRQAFRRLAPEGRICDVPTGVDINYFSPRGAVRGNAQPVRELVFTGSMDYYPNEDGVRYFIAEILPLIRARSPDIGVTIVGRAPTGRLCREAEAAAVTVTGRVADVRPYIASATVYVVPIRIGGGTRLKVFEALAMGKAVVSTSIGVEGLPLGDGTHFLAADSPQAFADAVTGLVWDGEKRRRLGEAGRRLMEERYAWPRVAEKFAQRCELARRSRLGIVESFGAEVSRQQ